MAPFVGRSHELALLERMLSSALAGHGQVANVLGEPGMGKSRLVYELARSAGDRQGPLTVLEGRCVSYGSLIPYLPLGDLIRAQCGVEDVESPDLIRQAIDRTVSEHDLPPDAGASLLRLVGVADTSTALDALSPEAVKARTFDVLRQAVAEGGDPPAARDCRRRRALDRSHVGGIPGDARRAAGRRPGCMLVATHRPGYRAPWLHRSYAAQITLAPLTPADSSRLVESVAPELPLNADVSSAILSRGEGNPFFLEELARTVLEHGPGTDTIPRDGAGRHHGARRSAAGRSRSGCCRPRPCIGREVPLRLLTRVWNASADIGARPRSTCAGSSFCTSARRATSRRTSSSTR